MSGCSDTHEGRLVGSMTLCVPGDEGESSASPHGKRQLAAVTELKKVYGLTDDVHATRSYAREA